MTTILVVDDDDQVRRFAVLALQKAGYTVLDAASPSAALEVAEPVDVLLTDVVLPEMDAFELAGLVQGRWPEVRVLYMSGYADASGEGEFIRKPFKPAELVAKVESLLDV